MALWANESLIEGGRSQEDIRQGVTLEVMGEGESMGPPTDTMKTVLKSLRGDIKYPITWTTLGGYLNTLVAKGVSPNVASFVGATTVREHVLGWDDRPGSWHTCRDISSEGCRQEELSDTGLADRENTFSAFRGTRDHGRHVPLHRFRNRSRCRHASLGAI